MAREIRIETVSYVRQNGETIPFEALTPEQQKNAATALKLALLRELAEEQQVLLFTCHGREREQLEGAPNVTVLSL